MHRTLSQSTSLPESKGWKRCRLKDIVLEGSGLQTGPFGSQLHASDYVSTGVPVVMPKDFADNSISAAGLSRVSSEKAQELDKYRLRTGDIVLARRGKIGRCALVTSEEDGWICGTGCFRARMMPTVDPTFLIQYLQWQRTVAWLNANAVGQTMQNLNTRIISSLPVDVPPLSSQRRIAEVLHSVDSTVSATQRVIEQTEIVRRGLVQHLLARGLAPNGPNGLRQETPEHWLQLPIGDLCTFSNGQVFKASEWSERGLPIIRIQNLNGSREFKNFAGEPKPNCTVETGELLFAWAGVKGVSFGPRIWDGPPGVLNQHIYRVRPHTSVDKVWLYETLRLLTRKIEDRAQGFKASLMHVRKADITSHLAAVPPFDEQSTIAQRARFVSEMETLERSNLEGLFKMKRALMNDLFLQRVDIPRLPKPNMTKRDGV